MCAIMQTWIDISFPFPSIMILKSKNFVSPLPIALKEHSKEAKDKEITNR